MNARPYALIITASCVLALPRPLAAESDAYEHPKTGDCVKCHKKETPGIVRDWRASSHFRIRVGCSSCHRGGSKVTKSGMKPVTAKVCGDCHEKQLTEYRASRHSVALMSGKGCTRNDKSADRAKCRNCHIDGSERPSLLMHCARFLKQTREMKAAGCERCHQVQDSCAACHTKHSTDKKIVQNPNVCATCHMGPDHPQWEAWQTSKHGTLYAATNKGPTCQTCHMPRGSHDVSWTVAAAPLKKAGPKDGPKARRKAMVKVCADCHGSTFARRELARADTIRTQGKSLVERAAVIIRDLYDRGLLDPMPADRAAHPLVGKSLVLDHQVLYEDFSHIERLFFKMKKYDLAKMVTGAYHQNPDYTHWYGNAEVKMDLVDIQAEARRLGRGRPARPTGSKSAPSPRHRELERQLRTLKQRFERKEISGDEYRRKRKLLLETFLRGAG